MAIDPQNYLTTDVPCLGCGYNLRGLLPNGVCPECGKSIEHSLWFKSLDYANLRWLRRLVRGMDLILAAGVAAVPCGIVTAIVLNDNQRGISPLCLFIAYCICGVLCLFGVLDLTAPDPGAIAAGGRSHRRSMRVWACTTLVAGASVPLSLMHNPLLFVICLCFFMVAGCMGILATTQYVRRLAERLPRSSLSRRTRVLQFWLIDTLLTLVVRFFAFRSALRSALARAEEP